MTGRLSRALRAQQQFVADASHELRTPLTGLRLRIEEARLSADGREPVAGELDAALGEVDRLSHVVNDLLLLSSAVGRDAPADDVELSAIARTAAERWDATAAESGITLLSHANGADGRVQRRARGRRPRARRACRERAPVFARRNDREDRGTPGAAGGRGRGSRACPRRGGAGLRALPPWARGPGRARRDGPWAADRTRADESLECAVSGSRTAPRAAPAR